MDGSLLGPPRFTAVPIRARDDHRLDARPKKVISSGSGSLRALEASGRRPRLSTTATPPKTPLLNFAIWPRRRRRAGPRRSRRATAFAPGGIPLYKLSLTQPLIVLAPVPARLAVVGVQLEGVAERLKVHARGYVEEVVCVVDARAGQPVHLPAARPDSEDSATQASTARNAASIASIPVPRHRASSCSRRRSSTTARLSPKAAVSASHLPSRLSICLSSPMRAS